MRSDRDDADVMYALVTPDGRIYVNPLPPAHPQALPPEVVVVSVSRSGEPPNCEMAVDYEASDSDELVKATLVEWAGATGHVRLWLPAEVIDLSDVLAPVGGDVTCNACGALHTASGMEFMRMVIAHGAFPTVCPCCAGRLPQWRPLGDTAEVRRLEPTC